MVEKKPRLFFIDNIRIVLIIGVVLVHLAVTYGAPGTWYYHEEAETDFITLIVYAPLGAIGQSLMGYFFLISAYFIPGSYDRKGPGNYVKDRLFGLGIPLLIYVLIIDPLIVYILSITLQDFKGTVLEFLSTFIQNYSSLGVGPLWFIEALLIFTLFYVIIRIISKPVTSGSNRKMPTNLTLASFALLLGVTTFILRVFLPAGWILVPLGLPISSFPQYISLFVIGTIAYYQNWFLGISDNMGKVWLWISVFLILVAFPILFILGGVMDGNTDPFMGGVHWQSFAFSIWEQFVCFGLIITSLVWFRQRFNHQGSLAQIMSTNAYMVYLIHAPILVIVSLLFRGVTIHPLVKFIVFSPVNIGVCFVVSYFFRKLPLVNRIF